MNTIWTALAGIVFGIGLIISGMLDPAKVLNFLDVGGAWDPSLAFVMAGAIAVTASGYWLVGKRARPLFDLTFHWPTARDVDARLLIGAALFGVGWGLVGLCPGPAIASLTLASPPTLAFIAALLGGVWLAARIRR